jgi:hypothetical protein
MSFYTDNNSSNVNMAAFGTTIVLGSVTIAACFAAAATATAVATVAYSVFALLAGAVSIASITAWYDNSSKSVETYVMNIKKHSMVTIPAMVQLVAQTMLQALVQAGADVIRSMVHDKYRDYRDGRRT